MRIRPLFESEYTAAAQLIYSTVHTICKNDYSQAELDVWAPAVFNMPRFYNALCGCFNLAALDNTKLVGFISVEQNGYINRLYTHKDYQHQGIASKLLSETERWARKKGLSTLSLDSSITAKGFYLKHGFYETGISEMERDGVTFRNSVMTKNLGRQEIS